METWPPPIAANWDAAAGITLQSPRRLSVGHSISATVIRKLAYQDMSLHSWLSPLWRLLPPPVKARRPKQRTKLINYFKTCESVKKSCSLVLPVFPIAAAATPGSSVHTQWALRATRSFLDLTPRGLWKQTVLKLKHLVAINIQRRRR
jgi:hypothetical protein